MNYLRNQLPIFSDVYHAYEEFVGLNDIGNEIPDNVVSEKNELARMTSIFCRYAFAVPLFFVLPPVSLFSNLTAVIETKIPKDDQSGDLTEEEIESKRRLPKEEIENHLKEYQLALKPGTKHQLEHRVVFNESRIESYCKEKIEEHAHPLALKFIRSIKIISMRELSLGLMACCEALNERLDLNQPYAVGVKAGKSQTWVAELCLPFLEKLPDRIFNLPVDTLGASEGIASTQKELETEIKQFVIFDDASYSGHQLETSIRGLKELIYQRFGYERCELYLVIPFISSKALDRLKIKVFLKKRVILELLLSQQIKK